jgi:hypothetical protein
MENDPFAIEYILWSLLIIALSGVGLQLMRYL